MAYAKSTIQSISLITQHIHDKITRFSATRRTAKVGQHSLVKLGWELQAVTEASRAILQVFDDPVLRRRYMLDDRLTDWLSGQEPESCLDTLQNMEKLLKIDHEVHAFSEFTPTRSGVEEDKVHAAILLFHNHRAYFHFLLTTDIWNYEHEVLARAVPPSIFEQKQTQDQAHPEDCFMEDVRDLRRQEIISEKLDDLSKRLMPTDCSEKQRRTLGVRQSGTCLWLFTTDAYKSWRKGTATFLWLQGKAGCGKTVLASTVINDLQNTKENDEFLTYFYCDFRSSRSTSAVDVMCSLLVQLTTAVCAIINDPECLLDELLKAADSHVTPFNSPQGVSRYLFKVAKLCPVKPFIIVDALDECLQIESLLDALTMSLDDARIFVTTRPLQNIVQRFLNLPCISMEKMANELCGDILLHVTRELECRPRLRLFNREVRREIQDTLCSRADGMFRWIQCQIDTLDRCKSISEIRSTLESLPEGLEETYRRILISINRCPPEARLVRRALVWLVTALRPMRLSELLEAVTIDPIRRVLDPGFTLMDDINFLEASRSLVIHHEETGIVTLAHMSVKEYLIGELVRTKLPKYYIILEDAHARLASLCMAYILFCLGEMKDCRDRHSRTPLLEEIKHATSETSRPLLKYVLSDGFSHLAHLGARNACILEDMKAFQGVILRHAWEWDQICELVPSRRSGIPWPNSEHDFTMYILIAFASDALFYAYLNHSDLVSRKKINPLVYAARFGKTACARALIIRGAKVNDRGLSVDKFGNVNSDMDDVNDEFGTDVLIADPWTPDERAPMVSPVEVAVDNWHTEVLDLLLDRGSVIPARLLTHVLKVNPHLFPLSIIRRLVQTGEFAEWAVTFWDNRHLLEAIVEDEEEYNRSVIDKDLMLITQRLVCVGYAEALLLVAIERGCVPVVKALFSINGPCMSSSSNDHCVISAMAANGDTPLHLAMKLADENRCLVLTRLLVEGHCDPCGLDADDRQPIQIAVLRGFISVVEYLLMRDVPFPSKILFTALQSPVVKRVEMFRFLISRKADVSVLNHNGDGLLHATMRSHDKFVCLPITQILVNAGCNPSTPNIHGETPLHIAAKHGYFELVTYLLLFNLPSDPSSFLKDSAERESILRSLVFNIKHSDLFEEQDEILQVVNRFILDQDACLELTQVFVGHMGGLFAFSSPSSRLFDIAIRQGFTEVVEFLVFQAIPPPSGILFAAFQHSSSMIPLLAHGGADPNIRDANGDTILHLIIGKCEEPSCLISTRALVDAGCDAFALDGKSKQPIEIAVSRGFISVVSYLLLRYEETSNSLPADLLFTALLWSDSESWQIVRILCEAGCDPFSTNDIGKHLIHISVSKGHIVTTNYLLSKYEDAAVALPADLLFTAIQSAHNSLPIIRLLVNHKADMKYLSPDGDNLLHALLGLPYSDIKILQILCEAGCDPFLTNGIGQQPIHISVSKGHILTTDHLLLEYEKAVVSPPRDLLFTAIRSHGPLPLIQMLVNRGADTKSYSNLQTGENENDSLLHTLLKSFQSDKECLEVLQVLCEAGSEPLASNSHERQPIDIAVSRGFLSVTEYLLKMYKEVNARLPADLLFTAIKSNQSTSTIQLLVNHGADVTCSTRDGENLLHILLRSAYTKDEAGCLQIVQTFCEAGCNAFATDFNGITPLHLAILKWFSTMVDYLLTFRTVPLPSDILIYTVHWRPLHYFRDSDFHTLRWITIVSSLILHGADIHARDEGQNTVLHRSMRIVPQERCLRLIKIFIGAGCDARARNGVGHTPRELAIEKGYTQVSQYLRDYLEVVACLDRALTSTRDHIGLSSAS